ncbi:hypothetical protein EDD18DRAFT_1363950 [Armillaria luteobubalina]|uniref:Uncharacterized protein n=1 Tax=Armillaria luteobubalina TaxID=153913 RepID=A0AA39UF73_9AGAR|nr:hypothetical protein EDD18DRAFT_1363950 [Armillaria luteobubalina]
MAVLLLEDGGHAEDDRRWRVCALGQEECHKMVDKVEHTWKRLGDKVYEAKDSASHGGVEQRSSWKQNMKERLFNDLGIESPDDAMKKLDKDLPWWKQAFANTVAISPLLLIMGQGLGQMLNMVTALWVGGHLVSHGKPEQILCTEELLWQCIIGIAWGSWSSDIGLKNFLTNIELIMKEWKMLKAQSQGLANDGEQPGRWIVYQREDLWFQESIAYMQKNPVWGLGARVWDENKEWLEVGKVHWLHWLATTGYETSMTTDQPRSRTRGR